MFAPSKHSPVRFRPATGQHKSNPDRISRNLHRLHARNNGEPVEGTDFVKLVDEQGAAYALYQKDASSALGLFLGTSDAQKLLGQNVSRKKGDLELLTKTYENDGVQPGTVFSSGSVYDAMIANLSKIAGQKAKIEAVLTAPVVAAAISASTPAVGVAAPSTQQVITQQIDSAPLPTEEGGLMDKPWFWPATIATGVLLVGGLAYYFTRSSEQPVVATTNRRRKGRK